MSGAFDWGKKESDRIYKAYDEGLGKRDKVYKSGGKYYRDRTGGSEAAPMPEKKKKKKKNGIRDWMMRKSEKWKTLMDALD